MGSDDRTKDHGVPGPGVSILVVEDHPATRHAVLLLLRTAFPSCRLQASASAEDAWPICDADPPAVVVMDISLPGMNGIEATQRIRAAYPATRVVMHSTSSAQIFRDGSAAAGACAFVSKGCASGELPAVIARLLASSG